MKVTVHLLQSSRTLEYYTAKVEETPEYITFTDTNNAKVKIYARNIIGWELT